MATITVAARWVKVAQPNPYKPGSEVSTFTTIRLEPCGAVAMALTLVILTGFIALTYDGVSFSSRAWALETPPKSPSNPAEPPRPSFLMVSRRFISILFITNEINV